MSYFCSTIIDRKVENARKIEVSDGRCVHIGNVSRLLGELLPDKRIIVVTDANVDRRYHQLVQQYEHFIVGLGETAKSFQTIAALCRRFVEVEVDRSCFILAIGGGIVTDIAGFAASIYMRGLDFGFVATTLLAQVDASVGGKNGINLDGYKNMVGTFTQPQFVICDPAILQTLPDREFRAGLAEVVKAAVIADAKLFETIESTSLEELRNDTSLLADVIEAAVRIKAAIVKRDERERGERLKLNLGHTFGHAIEKCSAAMNHGEAVAAGMAMIARIAEKLGTMSAGDAGRIIWLLERYGFELSVPVTTRRLANAIAKDKKMSGEFLHIVLPSGIGSCEIHRIPRSDIAKLMALL